ncbi:hypothetical protein EMIT036CA2_120021 [Chryseobacterium sp. IT-36CA2]
MSEVEMFLRLIKQSNTKKPLRLCVKNKIITLLKSQGFIQSTC